MSWFGFSLRRLYSPLVGRGSLANKERSLRKEILQQQFCREFMTLNKQKDASKLKLLVVGRAFNCFKVYILFD